MNCAEVDRLLDLREVDAAPMCADFQRHLRECDRCRGAHPELELLLEGTREEGPDHPLPFRGLRQRIRRAVFVRLALIAVVTAIGLGVFLVRYRNRPLAIDAPLSVPVAEAGVEEELPPETSPQPASSRIQVLDAQRPRQEIITFTPVGRRLLESRHAEGTWRAIPPQWTLRESNR